MIFLFVSAAVVAADAPQQSLAAYGDCVTAAAAKFKADDLSGDSSETVIHAAEVACRHERLAFVDAINAFTADRHSNLGPGSRSKVVDLFVRTREQEMEKAVASQMDGKGSN